MKIYETKRVVLVPFDDVICNTLTTEFSREPSIFEMTDLIADFPIKYQVVLMANLLTMSGITEKEIAECMNLTHLKYRQLLSRARKEFKNKGTKEM